MINNYFIILASGQSKRFNSTKPKQFIKYKNKALFEHSLDKAIESKLFKTVSNTDIHGSNKSLSNSFGGSVA